jgi:hypothetical protein
MTSGECIQKLAKPFLWPKANFWLQVRSFTPPNPDLLKSPYREWSQALTQILEILSSGADTFSNISKETILDEVLESSEGNQYLRNVVEIYRVFKRIQVKMQHVLIKKTYWRYDTSQRAQKCVYIRWLCIICCSSVWLVDPYTWGFVINPRPTKLLILSRSKLIAQRLSIVVQVKTILCNIYLTIRNNKTR